MGTAALALVGPGDLPLAIAAIVVSNVCFAYGESLIAAFLPELARREALGRVSGWGWSFGYFGGMLTLGLGLAYVLAAQGPRRKGSAVCASHDADNGGDLWLGFTGHLRLVEGARKSAESSSGW